jgi:hypothetical protein
MQYQKKERDSGLSLKALELAHNHSESSGKHEPGVSV